MAANVNLTSDDKLKIIALYKDGVPTQAIGDMFGISKARVSQIARENGLRRRVKVLPYTEDEIMTMYQMYMNGEDIDQIANVFGCNRASVYNLFHRRGLQLDDDRQRIYSVNDKYFDNIDTPNKAYILGLLWADGHNLHKKGIVEMRLQERDKHILEDISIEMKNQRPLYFVQEKCGNSQNTYKICITSHEISDALVSYGMPSNKTYVLSWPKGLPDHLVSHFLRGFTDGDGYISVKEIEWVGTEMMLSHIQEILRKKFHIDSVLRDTKTDVIKVLHICKRSNIINILNWIYKDADLKLNRKFLRYQQIINS